MARVEDVPSEEDDEPEVIIEDDATEQEEIESEASEISETEEAERVLEDKAAELEEQILKDPYNYDQHIQLIEILDKLSDLDRLRAAFKRLHNDYPLQPEHWLLWTHTEATVAHTHKDRSAVHDLYRRATAEVYSIQVYLQWLMFAILEGAEEARVVFAVITRRAGYDAAAAAEIWSTIVEYEKLHRDESSEQDVLQGEIKTRYNFYLDKTQDQDQEVNKIKEKLAVFEDRLLLAESEEKLEIYKEYIDTIRRLHDEHATEDVSNNYLEMVAALYDRASYECISCEKVDAVFTEYARLAPLLSEEAAACALDVCVTRRPLVAEYWVLTMQHLERHGRPFEEIKSTLERALTFCQRSPGQVRPLWLGYLESLRRHTDFEREDQRDILRNNLELAYEKVSEDEDPECTVGLLWARLEYTRLGEPAKGKGVFEKMFESSYNKCQSSLWLQLLELEQSRHQLPASYKILEKIRQQFKRAVRFTTDYPPAVCDRWLAFERDYGSLDSLVECKGTVEDALEQWRISYETKKEAKKNSKKTKNKYNKKTPNVNKKENDTEEKTEKRTSGKKRSADDDSTAGGVKKKREDAGSGKKRAHDNELDEADSKRQRLSGNAINDKTKSGPSEPATNSSEHAAPDKEACTLFVSNLDFNFSESSLRSALGAWGGIAALRPVRGVKAFGGSICYCEYTTPEAVDEAIKHDRFPLDGRPMFLSRYRATRAKEGKFRYPTTTERNKLFVRNLPFLCCSEERLRHVFDKYGTLKDVRVVMRKDGKPKGLAYVEYEDEKSAAAALQATDNLLLEDRHIQVAISAPPPKETPATSASLGQGRRDASVPRRTQLSTFIPRVLQKPSSAPSSAPNSSAAPSKTMSNSDFRNMLLGSK